MNYFLTIVTSLLLFACATQEKEKKKVTPLPEEAQKQEVSPQVSRPQQNWLFDPHKNSCKLYTVSFEELLSNMESAGQGFCEVKKFTGENIGSSRVITCGETSWFLFEDEDTCQLMAQQTSSSGEAAVFWKMVPGQETCDRIDYSLSEFMYALQRQSSSRCSIQPFSNPNNLPMNHINCGTDSNWLVSEDEEACNIMLQDYNRFNAQKI